MTNSAAAPTSTPTPARPAIVTVAIVILAATLVYRLYGELRILAFLYYGYGEGFAYQFGWALPSIGIAIFQAWVLWKVAQGRNWARIVTLLLVLFRVCVAAFILASPFAPMIGSLVIAVTQVGLEVLAVVLLLLTSGFFKPPQSED